MLTAANEAAGGIVPDLLILVDEEDRELGTADVFESHTGDGILHRAFTILVINGRGEVVIQKRSAGKRLWPLTWETSCSGHPRSGEDLVASSGKRLGEELGFEVPLEITGKFQYRARYGDEGSENELCYVLVGKYDGEVRPDPAEVCELRWIALEDLRRAIAEKPGDFAPWLPVPLELAATYLENRP